MFVFFTARTTAAESKTGPGQSSTDLGATSRRPDRNDLRSSAKRRARGETAAEGRAERGKAGGVHTPAEAPDPTTTLGSGIARSSSSASRLVTAAGSLRSEMFTYWSTTPWLGNVLMAMAP